MAAPHPGAAFFMPKKPVDRIAQAIREACLAYPDTREDHPWGECAFKVKDKTFVFMGQGDAGLSFSVKLRACSKIWHGSGGPRLSYNIARR